MLEVALSKGLLNPNLNINLFTCPPDVSYMYCELILTAANGNGMSFTAWITSQVVPQDQDLIIYFPTPTQNSEGISFNNYIKKDIFLVPGESLILNTQQTDLSYRLTGYAVSPAGADLYTPST
jgi:hypothetical protein